MSDLLARFLRELIAVFLDASPYILLGFGVAALLQVLLPVSTVERWLGRGRVRSIFVASLLGVPLPLCSCSVLPTAIALRKRGARRGATLSFLVSTPETGIDSIALTYGLMDPLMAIYRPFAAFVSAITAGFAAEILGDEPPSEGPSTGTGEADGAHAGHAAHDKLSAQAKDAPAATGPRPGIVARLRSGFRGAFVEIFDETSHWLLGGLVISALISVLLPATVVTRYLSSGAVPMVLMLLIGIPIYICASASTPIAAALVLKGLSPGAALVFLLAGPATNVGSLAILGKLLGRRVMVVYLATIGVLSLALGFLLDAIYPLTGITPGGTVAAARGLPGWFAWPCAVAFATLLVLSFRRVRPPSEMRRAAGWVQSLLPFRITPRGLGRTGIVVLAAWMCTAFFYQVPPGYRGLLKRFGASVGEPRGEGLHFQWPYPIEVAQVVPVDWIVRVEIGLRTPSASDDPTVEPAVTSAAVARDLEEESLYLTGDENLVDTRSVVQYRVLDPERYVWGFDDPERLVKVQAIAELLEVLASQHIDGVYTEDRPRVEVLVREGLARRLDALGMGVEILHYGIRDVHAPPEVHAAFRDVASAQEDKQTAINVALRYNDETVNLARGEAAAQVEEAKSFEIREKQRAEGGAVSLGDRADARRRHPVGTDLRLWLETVEKVLAQNRKIIRPGASGTGTLDLWISTGGGTAAAPAALDGVLRGSEARRDAASREESSRDALRRDILGRDDGTNGNREQNR